MTPRFRAAADTALLVETDGGVADLDARIAATPPAGVVETIRGMGSLLVEYDPLRTSHARLCDDIRALLQRPAPRRSGAAPREHEIGVVYDGVDLDAVARATELSAADVVRLHAGATYRVAMIGNLPGLPYLLGLDPRLQVPRRDDPRDSVPAGAVAIAGSASCIYPFAAPGGWHLLGRTDAVLFDAQRDPPSLLAPGDVVRFVERESLDVPVPSTLPVYSGGAALRVVQPGLLTTVQDAGRHGLQHIGVPVCGALDREWLHVANLLVGNPPDAAALEVTHAGPVLEVRAHSVRFAVAGDVEITRVAADGSHTAVQPWCSFVVSNGDCVRFGRVRDSLRCVVAVEGGVDVDAVLGSRSTCLRAHFGGLRGRALQRGDLLPLHRDYAGHHPDMHLPRGALHGDAAPIRVILGPQDDACTQESIGALLTTTLRVSSRSDRTGMRLDGVTLQHSGAAEIASEGCAAGSIQVPGSGRPIVLLADRGTTGGYPKVATVASVDLPRLARLRPGDALTLQAIDVAEAELLRRAREALLRALTDELRPVASR